MSPRNYADQVIVLKRLNFGEADRIITVFSRHKGKFSAIAKGVRKTTSRKAPHIELFSHAKLYFALGYNLPIVTQAETIDDYTHLKNNLETAKLAFHLLEVLDKLTAEEEVHTEIFDRLAILLGSLNLPNIDLQQVQADLAQFELDLLEYLGFGQPTATTGIPSFLSVNSYIESIIDRRLVSLNKMS